ncbi:MAG: transcriptional regulator MraZ [Abditibacteriota bacterium]|nr:transcriptional regulator MraZ [Abditibacteriota bacterium]
MKLAPDKNEPEAAAAMSAVPVMTGTHFHALDEKGRVIIPAKLRPALTEQFWMILDENDNIGIYNYQTGLDILEHCERMIAENPGDEDIAAAVERITGAADCVTVEGGYRVPVSEILRFYAQLDKEVVTVGVLNHAVIWSREKWEEAQARRLQSQEVRKAQAEMLRAAASSIRKKAEDVAPAAPAEVEIETREVATLATGTGGDLRSRTGTSGSSRSSAGAAPAAPAGDGKRSAKVLTLSQLGR